MNGRWWRNFHIFTNTGHFVYRLVVMVVLVVMMWRNTSSANWLCRPLMVCISYTHTHTHTLYPLSSQMELFLTFRILFHRCINMFSDKKRCLFLQIIWISPTSLLVWADRQIGSFLNSNSRSTSGCIWSSASRRIGCTLCLQWSTWCSCFWWCCYYDIMGTYRSGHFL